MKLGLGFGLLLAMAPAPARADDTLTAPAPAPVLAPAPVPAPAPAPAPADAATTVAGEATAPALAESAPPPVARAPTGHFALGIGYSPDDGFLARTEVAQDDLLRTGQRLALSAEVSAIRQRALLAHEAPGLLGGGFDLRTELFATRSAYSGFTREGAGGALTLGKRLSRATRIYARYRIERVGVHLDDPTDPASTSTSASTAASSAATLARMAPAGSLGAGLLATLGAGLSYSTLDAPVLPRRGSRLELFAERADRRLGSDHELLRFGGLAEHARPLGPFTLRLHGHAEAVRSRDPMGVPLALRLPYEGHAAVRGYGLGTGNPAGDNIEAVGRVELELPVLRRWGLSVAGFADAGLRYNADAAWGPRGGLLQRSVGVSVIWRSPIGLLRFDWAVPLDGERREPQFLFSLGGGF